MISWHIRLDLSSYGLHLVKPVARRLVHIVWVKFLIPSPILGVNFLRTLTKHSKYWYREAGNDHSNNLHTYKIYARYWAEFWHATDVYIRVKLLLCGQLTRSQLTTIFAIRLSVCEVFRIRPKTNINFYWILESFSKTNQQRPTI